jgi:predicted NBD/HSP70 family sugar kinase
VAKDRVPPGSQTSLREANRARVITVVQQRGSITQVELATVTGLSAATISSIVKELTTAGVLSTTPTSRSGRRAQSVTLVRNLGLVAGIHFGERSLRALLADVTQRVVAEQRLPLPPDHRADSGLDRAALLIEEMVDSVGAAKSEVLAVGVGLPAPVDSATGMVSASGVLRGWDWVPVAQVLGERMGVPVRVDNDANLGALAETRLGAAIGRRNVVYLRASYGIGLGLVVDGRVVHGRSGLAGEMGHVSVDPDGVACRCGRRGCLETVAGAGALLAGLQERHGHLALRDVVVRARDGDPDFAAAVARAGRRFGRQLAFVSTLLDPEMVVVGGEMARAGSALLDPLRDVLQAEMLRGTAGPVPVEAALLGEQAEARGAVAMAVDASRVVVSEEVTM